NCRSFGTSTCAACSLPISDSDEARRSAKASPMATSFTPSAPSNALRTAPAPLPPQPISPMRIASVPDAYAPGIIGANESPSVAAVVVLMKSRRDGAAVNWSALMRALLLQQIALLGTVPGNGRTESLEVVLLFHGADDAEPGEQGVGVPPDALRALRIPPAPVGCGSAASRAARQRRLIVPRTAARDMRKSVVPRQQHRPDRARLDRAVIPGVVLIEDPLADVAVHVEQPPRVRLLRRHGVRAFPGVLARPRVLAERARIVAETVRRRRAGARRVFPLGLGGQAVRLARLRRQPAAVFHRRVPRHVDRRLLALAVAERLVAVRRRRSRHRVRARWRCGTRLGG